MLLSPVFACGACGDALLESRHWLFSLAPFTFLALLLEGTVFALVTYGLRIESVSPRALPAAAAGTILTLAAFTSFGILLGVNVATLVLLIAAGWSLIRNRRFSPILTGVRVAIISVGVIAALWSSWPGHRRVDRLLDVAVYVAQFNVTDSWIIDELRLRPDALVAFERQAPNLDNEGLFKLHQSLGGAPAFRRESCRRLKARTVRMNSGLDLVCAEEVLP